MSFKTSLLLRIGIVNSARLYPLKPVTGFSLKSNRWKSTLNLVREEEIGENIEYLSSLCH